MSDSSIKRIPPKTIVTDAQRTEYTRLAAGFRRLSDSALTASKLDLGDAVFAAGLNGYGRALKSVADLLMRQANPLLKRRPSDFFEQMIGPLDAVIEAFAKTAQAEVQNGP